ncbi:MAG: hypothetical protein Q8K99_06985 [Actinomycetota bacterium]|nr:hypothetical protein [Actinomycetota bacterium]
MSQQTVIYSENLHDIGGAGDVPMITPSAVSARRSFMRRMFEMTVVTRSAKRIS